MSQTKPAAPLSPEETEFFQGFYQKYKGFIYYIANRCTAAPADCEDVVQDSVIRLMCNTRVLMELNHPKTVKYIAITVKSAFLDHERKLLAARKLDLDEDRLAAVLERFQLHSDADQVRVQMDMYQLKQTLSERDWLLLEGKYILGYSQEELAQLIGVSSDSIRMILHRARKNAREILLTDTDKGGGENG